MNGNQIKDSLNLISMQMNGLRGAGEFGKFGTDMLRTMSQEWQKTEKKKDKKKKSADKNKKDLMQKEKKNNRTNGTAGKKETPQAISGSMAVGNIAAAPDAGSKNGRWTSESSLRAKGKEASESSLRVKGKGTSDSSLRVKGKGASESSLRAKGSGAAGDSFRVLGHGAQHNELYGPRGISLQEAFVWSEILGEPMAHKRRTRRVNQRYGNQSNADRR